MNSLNQNIIAELPKALLLGLIMVLFVIPSCVDEIDFDLPAGVEDALVIQGQLLKGDPSTISVEVVKLFDFTGANRNIAVQDVFLQNSNGEELELDEIREGIYFASIPNGSPNFTIDNSSEYWISLRTFDGRKYQSTNQTLRSVPEISSMRVAIETKEVLDGNGDVIPRNVMSYYINTPLRAGASADKARLFWQINRNYRILDNGLQTCYIDERQSINDIKPVDGSTLSEDNLTDYFLFDTPLDHRYAFDAYISVSQFSLDPGAFEYRRQISELQQREGSIFEDPVGKLISNIENTEDPNDIVYGYFEASEVNTFHFFVDSLDAGAPPALCPPNVPPPPGGGCPVLVCCDCTLAGGSLIKPDYWTE